MNSFKKNLSNYFLIISTGLIYFFPGAKGIGQTTVVDSFMFDGIIRSYRIYVPAIYNPAMSVPLLYNLHGYTSNNVQQEFYADFRPIADTAGFIIIHPNGTVDGSGNLFWNTFGASSVDDVGFLSALLDTVISKYNIDENRIYSTGMSNGGFMSYDLACLLSGRIAAIASVTGSMNPGHKNACSPQHPTPVMEIHGTADGTVPYTGNVSFVPIDSLVKYWVQFNNCNPSPVFTNVPDINTADGCTAEHYVFSGGVNGTTVELFKIIGGGHSWPGAPVTFGVTNRDINASIEIWRFLSKYKLNVLTAEPEIVNSPELISVSPNPSEGVFSVEMQNFNQCQGIEVYNFFGEKVFEKSFSSGSRDDKMFENQSGFKINLSAQPSGIYVVIVRKKNYFGREKLMKY